MKKSRLLASLLVILMLCTASVFALPESTSTVAVQQQGTTASFYGFAPEDISNICTQDTHTAFVLQENKLVCVDSETGEVKTVYTADYQIQLLVPYFDKGIMFGSALPSNPDGTSFDASELRNGLSWDGTYEYLDYVTGEILQIENPSQLFLAASSGIQNVDYSTIINGQSVPLSNYKDGSIWQSEQYTGYFGSGYQCYGFALYVYDTLFGNTGKKIVCNGIMPTQSFLESLPLGSFIRVNENINSDTNPQHAMILIGRDSGGVYIYHANWSVTTTNVVSTSYATWTQFMETFPEVNFYICPHSVSVWKQYSASVHQGTCTACGTSCTQPHYAAVAGTNVTCLACGYKGSMDGFVNIEEGN